MYGYCVCLVLVFGSPLNIITTTGIAAEAGQASHSPISDPREATVVAIVLCVFGSCILAALLAMLAYRRDWISDEPLLAKCAFWLIFAAFTVVGLLLFYGAYYSASEAFQ